MKFELTVGRIVSSLRQYVLNSQNMYQQIVGFIDTNSYLMLPRGSPI